MKIEKKYSPNCDKKKRSNKSIKILIIHYTGMQSERESLLKLTNPSSKVSAHFLIYSNGKAFRLAKDNQITWHAGISCWKKYKNLNKNSIGIELTNAGHQFGYKNFKRKQLIVLEKICKHLIKKYKIKADNIVGHSDIAPSRKIDPGEKFPWKKFASKKIGIWHQYKPDLLKKFRRKKVLIRLDKIKFFNNLKKIGYCSLNKNKFYSKEIIKAFQRHYRTELINGLIDKECIIIAESLSKNC
jgi:N-acetylmuramoyl-L-alanine amidase